MLLEHERQQQMAKIHSGPGGPDMGPRPPMMSSMSPGNPMRGVWRAMLNLISIAVLWFCPHNGRVDCILSSLGWTSMRLIPFESIDLASIS